MTPTIRAPSLGVYYIVTAYSVTSAFTTDGDCVTVSGTPITLPTPFSVIPQSSPANLQELQSSIDSDFAIWLDIAPTCSVVAPSCNDICDFNNTPAGAVGFPGPNSMNVSDFDLGRAI